MQGLTNISPEILKNHHRLTSQQINSIAGRVIYPDSREEKIAVFEMVRQLIAVSDALAAAAINSIPLKGPVLSYRLYGDPTCRHYSDLDILLKVTSVSRATVILKELGYMPVAPGWPENTRKQQILVKHTNEIAFTHPEKGITIELHWQLIKTPPVSVDRLEDIVNRNKTTVNFGGRSFFVFSNELELLYLIIHGGAHWWRRLKWLADINTFLKTQTIDWEQFRILADELKATRMVALCQAIHSVYFPDGPVLPCQSRVRPFMLNFSLKRIKAEEDLIHDFHKRAFQTVIFSLTAFPGIMYKIRLFRNYMFVKEYYGKRSFFDRLPLFYFYGMLKLAVFRSKR